MASRWWFLEMGIAATVTLMHFWMKLKLMRARLPVVWLMWPHDDWRMWKTYRSEAPERGWPVWPFFAYWTLIAVCIPVFIIAITHSPPPWVRDWR